MTARQIVLALRKHADMTQAEFGDAVGVTGAAINLWEHGGKVSPFNRMRLLAFAKEKTAPQEIVAALEAVQPEMRP